MPILQLGNPILNEKSKKIEPSRIRTSKIQSIIDRLLDTVHKRPGKAAGLAAPQIGELKDIVVVNRLDLLGDDALERNSRKDANGQLNPKDADKSSKDRSDKKTQWDVMINPEIIKEGDELSTVWEGCLSVKNGDLFGEVTRPSQIELSYYDREGNQRTLKTKDFFSHVVQHEMDHLDGVLFLEYIKDPASLLTGIELERLDERDEIS